MPFSAAQIEHYKNEGYLSGPRVLSDEQINTLRERVDDILHLMPGHTRRLGDNWNERMGNVETVAVGETVQGPDYPELAAA